MKISQTLMKDVLPVEACGKFIYYRHHENIPTPSSDLMDRGSVFEHGLIGACRGDVPELKKLKTGKPSKAEQDLQELITYSKWVIDELGLDLTNGQAQVEIEVDDLIGHLDYIGQDIMKPERKAIYDIKYTETKQDDRWNGWADFDSKTDAKIQASQYILLYHMKTGDWVPYYFLVFGKSLWVRVIKVVMTAESVSYHQVRINATREKLQGLSESGWPANPEFNKCQKCPFNDICKDVSTKPSIEVYMI